MRKQLSVLMAGLMVLSLAACGEEVKTIGGGDNGSNAPVAATAEAAGAETTPAADADAPAAGDGAKRIPAV